MKPLSVATTPSSTQDSRTRNVCTTLSIWIPWLRCVLLGVNVTVDEASVREGVGDSNAMSCDTWRFRAALFYMKDRSSPQERGVAMWLACLY